MDMQNRMSRMRRITYANVMATIAVFVSLAGVTWAAATITGANIVNGSLYGVDIHSSSLGGSDIADGMIRSADVSGLTAVDISGLGSADIVDGSLGISEFSDAAVESLTGADASGTAAANAVQRGVWTIDGYDLNQNDPNIHRTAVTYAVPLPVAPLADNMHYVLWADMETPPEGCNGTYASPDAAPGHLCVYESATLNAGPSGDRSTWSITGAPGDDVVPNRLGFMVQGSGSGGGPFTLIGTWAYRAPLEVVG